MTMLDVLWATRRQLDDPKHWWKGDGMKHTDENCVGLALMDNAALLCAPETLHADTAQAATALAKAADIPRSIGLDPIYRWNDDPRTTHAELLAALDKAIATEKSREAA